MFQKSLLFLFLACCSPSLFLFAQCGHSYVQNQAFAQQPNLRNFLKQSRLQSQIKPQAKTFKTQSHTPDTVKYTIPVVIHVIHTNGPEKIPVEQILSAFPALNQDFRNIAGTRGKNGGVDTQIEFALATQDTNGNPHTGINYVVSPLTNHDMSNDLNLKDLIRWKPDKYLNIWLVKEIASGGSSGGTVLGYAYYPGVTAEYDGIVIRSDCWGSKEYYPQGSYFLSARYNRTATHEIGHYLNLPHTFEGGCNNGDDIADTPPVAESNFGCPTRVNSCGNDVAQGASEDRLDQVRNFMDYADGHCADLFTPGQVAVMHDAIETYRSVLVSPANLQATGVAEYQVPYPHFWTSQQALCPGHTTQLIDFSSNKPNSWHWTVTGGIPYDSLTFTTQHPWVTLNNPGTYQVKLSSGNSAGNSFERTRTHVLSVGQDMGTLPLVEGFESTMFPPAGWRIENPNQFTPEDSITFSRYTITGGFRKSFRSARIINYSSRSIGQWDALVLPQLDVTNESNLYFSFSKSYAQLSLLGTYPLILSDTLYLEASVDCGDSWQTVWVQGGSDLATTPPYDGALANMDSSQWQRVNLDVSAWVGYIVQFRFRSVFYGGNNLYLDDVVIDRLLANTPTEPSKLYTQIYPNPGKETLCIRLIEPKQAQTQVLLMDLTGKILLQQNTIHSELDLNTQELPSGMYLIHIQQGTEKYTTKWVKE